MASFISWLSQAGSYDEIPCSFSVRDVAGWVKPEDWDLPLLVGDCLVAVRSGEIKRMIGWSQLHNKWCKFTVLLYACFPPGSAKYFRSKQLTLQIHLERTPCGLSSCLCLRIDG